tara:strand:+ start:3006 stop:5816 length:2811 start_codon:yes stop_codon:yes gene_type:complete
MKKTLIAIAIVMISCSSDKTLKHPLDKSASRTIVLENGLKIFLLSDPSFNVSAASMSVEVGNYQDPKNREGLAHFLEHMLFLGTEKYPDVDEYSTYLKTNGGYSNAYTDGDLTNYQFQVLPDAFSGALDRFSQFFISPLFTEKYTEREVNAVNSEYQKNIMNDGWRLFRIRGQFTKKDHPEQKFNIGNLETLGDIDRKELIDFYKKYYSANRMGLSLLSTHTLDEMEQWVRSYFSSIKNNNRERNAHEVDVIEPKEAIRIINVNPIKDIRQMNIVFAIPGTRTMYESKPGRQFGFIIGHEGKGSLLSFLKDKGWAISLGAGASSDTKEYGFASVSIGLTEKGLKEYREVLKAVVGYIQLMKKEGYQPHIYNELKSMALLDEVYSNKGEGMGRAIQIANETMQFPIKDAGRVRYVYRDDTPASYNKLLSEISIKKMLVSLVSKELPTDKTEYYFQIKHSYMEDKELYKDLSLTTPNNELLIPEENPFIPKDATVPTRELKESVYPKLARNEKGIQLFFGQDHEFLRPKGVISLKIMFPKEKMDINHRVYSKLYTACVNESLNELSYPAKQAGLNYTIREGYEGVYVDISGYRESAMFLYGLIVEHLVDFSVTETQFSAIKDKIVRDYENFSLSDAHQQTRELSPDILWNMKFTWEESLPVAKNATLASVKAYGEDLYEKTFLEAMVYGDLEEKDANGVVDLFKQKTQTEGVARDEVFDLQYLSIENPEDIQYSTKLLVNNSCFFREYMVGKDSPDLRAKVKIIGAAIQQPFYTEMRTNQQLGYIVWSYSSAKDETHFLSFLIQSGVYPADELDKRAGEFLLSSTNILKEMDDEMFQQLIKSEIEKLERLPKSIAERSRMLKTLIFEHDADYKRDNKTIAALKNLNKNDVVELMETIFSPESRKMINVLTFAENHKDKTGIKNSFDSLEDWKSLRVYQ